LALFGVLKDVHGETRIEGKPVTVKSPHDAKRSDKAIALIPEDRKTEGLMLPMDIARNISLSSLGRLRKGAVLDAEREAAEVARIVKRLQIKVNALDNPVSSLSGGNQQKVVLAKWLLTEPRLLMLNDPTRGIDVGTKQEIYQLLRELADAGTAILLYSTDSEELIGCADRVLIFYQGRIVRELTGSDINEHNIVASALNIHESDAPGNSAKRAESAGGAA
jgi:ribose transport system ATP-binding protein